MLNTSPGCPSLATYNSRPLRNNDRAFLLRFLSPLRVDHSPLRRIACTSLVTGDFPEDHARPRRRRRVEPEKVPRHLLCGKSETVAPSFVRSPDRVDQPASENSRGRRFELHHLSRYSEMWR